MKTINERVMAVADHYNLSMGDFAQQLGVSPAMISHIKSGRNKASLELVQKICVSFPKVNTSWLLNNKGEMFGQMNFDIDWWKEKLNLLQRVTESTELQLMQLQNEYRILVKKLRELES